MKCPDCNEEMLFFSYGFVTVGTGRVESKYYCPHCKETKYKCDDNGKITKE